MMRREAFPLRRLREAHAPQPESFIFSALFFRLQRLHRLPMQGADAHPEMQR
jgi:hypothetical protein